MAFSPLTQAPCHDKKSLADDKRICATAEANLRASGYAPLRRVRCEVVAGVIVLSGDFPSFYMKQVAQAALVDIDGKTGVENRLRVEYE